MSKIIINNLRKHIPAFQIIATIIGISFGLSSDILFWSNLVFTLCVYAWDVLNGLYSGEDE